MISFKRALSVGFLGVGLALAVSVAVPAKQASAQYGYGGYGGFYNPIASWIVLDGLFGPR